MTKLQWWLLWPVGLAIIMGFIGLLWWTNPLLGNVLGTPIGFVLGAWFGLKMVDWEPED